MTTATTTLTEFLLQRIAEDEADPWRGAELIGADRVVGRDEREALAQEQAEWEARVLAECEAKRRIVALDREAELGATYAGAAFVRTALRALAAVYADHPDYREEWRP